MYPEAFSELATIVNHIAATVSKTTGLLPKGVLGSRPPADMPHMERARRILAQGIPHQELGHHYSEGR